jgi:hypothetical protein
VYDSMRAGCVECGSSDGLEEAMSRVTVSSLVSETAEDKDGGSYTVYRIRCCVIGAGNGSGQGACSWEVSRRYSEFHELHTLLRTLGTVVTDLPRKNPFAQMMSAVRKSRYDFDKKYFGTRTAHPHCCARDVSLCCFSVCMAASGPLLISNGSLACPRYLLG